MRGNSDAGGGEGESAGGVVAAEGVELRFDDCAYGARVLGRDGILGRGEMRREGKEQRSEETRHGAISDAEQLLERSRCRADRLRIGALLGLVLRGGEAVAGAAVDLVLEGELRAAQLFDQAVDRGERKARILGAVQDQEHALGVRRPSRCAVAERTVNRDIRSERRAGCREFDAYPAAEAVADERDPGGV